MGWLQAMVVVPACMGWLQAMVVDYGSGAGDLKISRGIHDAQALSARLSVPRTLPVRWVHMDGLNFVSERATARSPATATALPDTHPIAACAQPAGAHTCAQRAWQRRPCALAQQQGSWQPAGGILLAAA